MVKPTTSCFELLKPYAKETDNYAFNYGEGRKVEDMVEFSDNNLGGDKTVPSVQVR